MYVFNAPAPASAPTGADLNNALTSAPLIPITATNNKIVMEVLTSATEGGYTGATGTDTMKDMAMAKESMDHGMHDMPGMKMCKMSMTLNSEYENVCILTEKLMVTSKTELVLAMVGIILFTLGYEYFKRFVEVSQSRYCSFLKNNAVTENERLRKKSKLSILYGLSVGYSFVIMLLFMTFNVWIMLAVCVGAGLGHYLFHSEANTVPISLACH